MKVQVEGDVVPPELLVEAAAAYASACCPGVIELWQDLDGYWNATLAHDERCRLGRTGAVTRRPNLAVAIG
ncbi:hypothetical protein [Frankia sp. Cppng1_Ct_nod]|uniref:hypothetical protein n=1 Tax=Frankia sp. Cppng1_Ct_nod TaxID=2897162 RepID=UPI002024E333|nr:hypothetical protein [Frankia sp. Cppng1_Ct_nod]